MKIKIDKHGISEDTKQEIQNALPQPKEYAGWVFDDYSWEKLDSINITKDGFTDNSVRIAGTPDGEILEASLSKGLDITKLTPSICPENNLLNGFTRYKTLKKLGYQEWIFSNYKIDKSTKSEFQINPEDYVDDFRLSANDGDGAVAVTKEEIIEIARKRFAGRKDRSKLAVCRYVYSLNLNQTKSQVEGIAQTVSKHYKRQGVIEPFTRKEAEDWVTLHNLDCEILNTKDKTRTARFFPQIMKNFIDTGEPLEYVDFHSDACTHKEIDDGRKDSTDELLSQHDLCFAYVAAVTSGKGKIPWVRLGSLAQKINVEKGGTLIE